MALLQRRITPADILAFVLYVNIILGPIQRLMNFTEQFHQGAASFERFTEIMDIEPDWIIRDISLSVDAGESVAIVGESGAGKSTIVSLVPRFYEPLKGTVSIDGRDVMSLKQRFLRENIGLVQQNVFLFEDTIRENIM